MHKQAIDHRADTAAFFVVLNIDNQQNVLIILTVVPVVSGEHIIMDIVKLLQLLLYIVYQVPFICCSCRPKTVTTKLARQFCTTVNAIVCHLYLNLNVALHVQNNPYVLKNNRTSDNTCYPLPATCPRARKDPVMSYVYSKNYFLHFSFCFIVIMPRLTSYGRKPVLLTFDLQSRKVLLRSSFGINNPEKQL